MRLTGHEAVGAPRPTIASVPRGLKAEIAVATTSGIAVVSAAATGPPPVRSCSAATTSVSGRVDGGGGAQISGQVASLRLRVDGDDGATPGHFCAHHSRQADRTGPEDRDRVVAVRRQDV